MYRKEFLFVLMALFVMALVTADEPKEQKDEKAELQKEVEAQVKDTMAEVSKIRGKEYCKTVPVGIQSPDNVVEFVLKAFEEDLRPGEMDEMKAVMVKFGLLSPDVDLKAAIVKMLKENVAGMYVPKEKKLYLSESSARNKAALIETLAHELCHALQDQYFDVQAFVRHIYDSDDRALAAQAVVEGEATAVGIEVALQRSGMSITKLPTKIGDLIRMSLTMQARKTDVPKVLMEMLVFPYIYGSNFVQAFVNKKGFKELDRLFIKPPLSTEQLLHPDKYFSDEVDYPVEIVSEPLDKLFGEKWELLADSSAGEFIIGLVGRQFVTPKEAATMAAGWGGDRYNIVREKETKRTVLAWFTTWDSNKDAKEFFETYTTVLEKKYSKQATKTDETAFFWAGENELVWLEMNENDVLVIESVTKDELPNVREYLGKAKKVEMSAKSIKIKERKINLPEPPKQEKGEPKKEEPKEF